MTTIYDFSAVDIKGVEQPLAAYRGQVLLIVNTASKCGFTPQYEGLEALYKQYGAEGLVILGFPCNQFGAQEQGDEAEIERFCSLNFDVSFPMFAKIDVNGPSASPLYNYLKDAAPGIFGSKNIKWNFTKFLIGKEGQVLQRFAPTTKPKDIESAIKKALAA